MKKEQVLSLKKVLWNAWTRCVLTILLLEIVWLLEMAGIKNSRLVLPAERAEQTARQAAEVILPEMTVETFDPDQLSPLCRYVLYDTPGTGEIQKTNMDRSHLKKAQAAWKGESTLELGARQYYLYAKLQDGKTCQLQYDFRVQYANEALRGVLPDLQSVQVGGSILLMLVVMAVSTHRTGTFLIRNLNRLAEVQDLREKREE